LIVEVWLDVELSVVATFVGHLGVLKTDLFEDSGFVGIRRVRLPRDGRPKQGNVNPNINVTPGLHAGECSPGGLDRDVAYL